MKKYLSVFFFLALYCGASAQTQTSINTQAGTQATLDPAVNPSVGGVSVTTQAMVQTVYSPTDVVNPNIVKEQKTGNDPSGRTVHPASHEANRPSVIKANSNPKKKE
jgi:hypothetical protein